MGRPDPQRWLAQAGQAVTGSANQFESAELTTARSTPREPGDGARYGQTKKWPLEMFAPSLPTDRVASA